VLCSKIFLLLVAAFLFCTQSAFAETPTPAPMPDAMQTLQPESTRTSVRMATRLPTPLPGGGMFPAWMTPPASGPTQSDAGALLYYYNCMACHGDQGQGLTVQWRAQWDVEHQDCARSTCHGARHPPEGFSFPKNFAPALVGVNALTRFANAQTLYDFISTRMPYQAPGSLTHQEYWQLVAFLLQRRGVSVSHIDETNAAALQLNPTPQDEILLPVIVISSAVMIGLSSVLFWRVRKRFK
jgi:mono/diheme cytochrome c family protein